MHRRRSLIDDAQREVDRRHHRRAHHRRPAAGDVGVRRQQHDGGAGRPAAANANRPQHAQHQAGEDRDVAAGDGDDVIRAGFLQPLLDQRVERAAVADQDRDGDRRRLRVA